MFKKCLECGNNFKPSNSNLKKGGGKFCSMRCYHTQCVSHKKGTLSPFWKGSGAKYGSIHDWIKYHYGKASKCENPSCVYPKKSKNGVLSKAKIFDWALKKGSDYSNRSRENFIQLCRSCHKKYDYIENKHKRNRGTYV